MVQGRCAVVIAGVGIGAGLQQAFHGFRGAVSGSLHQGRVAAIHTVDVRIGSSIEQAIDQIRIRLPGGGVQRRMAFVVLNVNVRSALQKRFDGVLNVEFGRQIQRGAAMPRFRNVRVRSAFDQVLHHVGTGSGPGAADGAMQRRFAVPVVACVGIGSRFEQAVGGIQSTIGGPLDAEEWL